MKNNLSTICTGVLLILDLVLSIGTQYAFHACAAGDDGSYMSCHWAQMAVVTIGAVVSAISLVAILIKDRKIRMGLVLAEIPAAVAAMLIPNTVIRLCMMNTMRCHAVMKPAAMILGILIVIFSVITVVISKKEASFKEAK